MVRGADGHARVAQCRCEQQPARLIRRGGRRDQRDLYCVRKGDLRNPWTVDHTGQMTDGGVALEAGGGEERQPEYAIAAVGTADTRSRRKGQLGKMDCLAFERRNESIFLADDGLLRRGRRRRVQLQGDSPNRKWTVSVP